MARNQDTSVVSPVVLSLATAFLILSSVSAPIFDGIRMFRLKATINGAKRFVDFGIWGYCIEAIAGVSSFDSDVVEGCTDPALGFIIDDAVAGVLRSPYLINAISKGHTSMLVMFPVATIVSFISALLAVALWWSRRRNQRDLGTPVGVKTTTTLLVFNTLAVLVVLIAFIAQLSVGLVIWRKVDQNRVSGGTKLVWDNIPWLSGLALLAHLWNWGYLLSLRGKLKKAPKAEHFSQGWTGNYPTSPTSPQYQYNYGMDYGGK